MIVAELPVPLATLPTAEITPGVDFPSGMVTVTLSPLRTSDCWETSRLDRHHRPGRVAVNTAPDAAEPSCADTLATRMARGSNTAWPNGSSRSRRQVPVRSAAAPARTWCPRRSNPSPAPAIYPLSAYPSATRSWLSWDTSCPVIPSFSARHAGTRPYSRTPARRYRSGTAPGPRGSPSRRRQPGERPRPGRSPCRTRHTPASRSRWSARPVSAGSPPPSTCVHARPARDPDG